MSIISKEELVNKVSDPKVLPFVAKKVLEIVGNENVSIAEICHAIEKDQTITASVLKISNSAFYGLQHEVTSIRQAIMVLGLKSLRTIVVAVSTKLQYKRFGITEQLMWDHSIGAAIAARYFASSRWKELEELAFLGGLMHDFGKIIMNNECPQEFSEVMQRIYNEGEDSLTAENSIFGYNHTDIGPMVMKKWEFPAIFVHVLGDHHLHKLSLADVQDPAAARVVACVHVGDNICKRLGMGYRSPDIAIPVIDSPVAQLLNLSDAGLARAMEDIQKIYTVEKAGFQ